MATGNLRGHSVSYKEMIDSHRSFVQNIIVDYLGDKVLGAAGADGLPDDLKTLLKDHMAASVAFIQIAAVQGTAMERKVFTPAAESIKSLVKRFPSAQAVIEVLVRMGFLVDARKILTVATTNGLDALNLDIRLVAPNLTFEEARRCNWNGTLAECRLGSVLTGAANPRDHFVIYLPAVRAKLRSGLDWTVCGEIYQ